MLFGDFVRLKRSIKGPRYRSNPSRGLENQFNRTKYQLWFNFHEQNTILNHPQIQLL